MPSIYEFWEIFTRIRSSYGWGWMFAAALLVAGALGFWWFYRRWYRPLRMASPFIEFFENQHVLNAAIGSLTVELEKANEVDAVWPAGGSAQNVSSQALKNIRRLIVRSADAPDSDLKAYAERFGAFDSDEVRSAIRTLTKKARQQGAQVRWHPDPAFSAVINNKTGEEWVRIELLLSHVESMQRPSIRISRRDYPKAFRTAQDMFEGLWKRSTEAPAMLAAPLESGPRPEKSAAVLTVRSARYGLGDRWVDVTVAVRKQIQNNRIRFRVKNAVLGCDGDKDPVKGTRKELEVLYALDGVEQPVKRVTEKEECTIP